LVRSFLRRKRPARGALAGADVTAKFWQDLSALGWLGLHLPVDVGGSGFGLIELAIVVEALGRACAPGAFLPAVVVSGAVAAAGTPEQRGRLLPGLASGMTVAGLGPYRDLALTDGLILAGTSAPVVCAEKADVLGLVVAADLVIVESGAPGVMIDARANIDLTRPSAPVACDKVKLDPAQIIVGGGRAAIDLLAVLPAAEASGIAAACHEAATEYAKSRRAFGRPIGQFQAVKHQCADMLIEEKLAVATTWNAARLGPGPRSSVFARAAVAVAMEAAMRCAKLSIQVHGGIGFTWEHDAHLLLRRATALQAIAGPLADSPSAVAELGLGPALPVPELEPSLEGDRIRAKARAFAARYRRLPAAEAHRFMVEADYLFRTGRSHGAGTPGRRSSLSLTKSWQVSAGRRRWAPTGGSFR
jgi:alkylation response protein AidB-like acyl-CoA dehydrogenase